MLISLKFPEGVAFQPIMSNLEEEIIEKTTPIRGNLWETRKASIACLDRVPAKGFGMKKKLGPRVRSVYYCLKCCMETRFRKMASTGSTLQPGPPNVQ